jgi:hypothetical protein
LNLLVDVFIPYPCFILTVSILYPYLKGTSLSLSVKRKNTTIVFLKENRKKESHRVKEGRKGCQDFGQKYYPSVRGWRFFTKPVGPGLDRPVGRLIFAAIFLIFVC